ncbi:MAG: MOSC domain-containing protein [Opitutaceae bacterium]|nr:MOSC domain-containing protein [Opitutaceae bacterium]
MHLSGLYLYPVKSLRGIAVASASLDAFGLVHDRRFLVVDDRGRFLTQRALPRMALITTALTGGTLILRNPHHGSAAIGLDEPGAPVTVQIWRDTVEAVDCGVEIAVWLSDFLRQPCRLVRMGERHHRSVHKAAARPGDQFAYADGAPLLVLSEASLAGLNDRLVARGEEPVPMDRFRPNLVIAGCPAHAEDGWSGFRLGDLTFRCAGKSDRCTITTTNQLTGERAGPEPLRTLAAYRRDPALDPTAVWFGANYINASKSGLIRAGDPVVVD